MRLLMMMRRNNFFMKSRNKRLNSKLLDVDAGVADVEPVLIGRGIKQDFKLDKEQPLRN